MIIMYTASFKYIIDKNLDRFTNHFNALTKTRDDLICMYYIQTDIL